MGMTPLEMTTGSENGRLLIVTHQLPWVCSLSDFSAKANGSLYPSLPRSVARRLQTPPPQASVKPSKGETEIHISQRRGHSALFSGVRSLTAHQDSLLHIGWSGYIHDEDGLPIDLDQLSPALQSKIQERLLNEKQCVAVMYSNELAMGHYDGYCKSNLWPIFHYHMGMNRWDHVTNGSEEKKHWEAYVAVNEAFAETILKAYQPGDTIWIHDYHLLLVPEMVRKKIPGVTIGFFLHTPFPSSELFRCLPNIKNDAERKEILKGALGSTLIGFQTYAHARHFISSCTRVLGCESDPKGVDYHGVTVFIGIFPIGIDVHRANLKRKSPAVLEKIQAIRNMYAGKHIIFGRDKLDSIKGIKHKLAAFEKFLTMYPKFQNKVVLIQVTSPSHADNSKLESKVSELVSRINGNFGSLEFVPVHHYHQHLEVDDYFALLGAADIGLVTSTRDGMNTTSHEFVICQEDNHGVLILSEFTGTAGSLSSALLVNPWDYVGVANTIHEALVMPREERSTKHQALYQHICSHTSDFWAHSFLKQLAATEAVPQQSNPTPFLDQPLFIRKYNESKHRLFLFDYDGTLTPIRKTPNAAIPSAKMLQGLESLVKNPFNHVFVVSGRDQAFLDHWLGHIPGLGLSAEHGCFIKYPNETKWINLSAEFDLTWKNEVAEIFSYYTERTQGSFIEHKRCSITWHYRLADPQYGNFQAKECQNHLENLIQSKLPVEVMLGKKNLEVRPVAINKGEVVKRIMGGYSGLDFVYCVGDDRTDEDMFKVLKRCNDIPEDRCFTCTIGLASKKTSAGWHVSSPDDVIALLSNLAEL